MNWFLAEMLRWGNGILAIFIVMAAFAIGNASEVPGGAIFGALGGVLTATVICGILAILLDIRNKLADIARNTARD